MLADAAGVSLFLLQEKVSPGGVNLTAGTFPVGHIGKMSLPRDLAV